MMRAVATGRDPLAIDGFVMAPANFYVTGRQRLRSENSLSRFQLSAGLVNQHVRGARRGHHGSEIEQLEQFNTEGWVRGGGTPLTHLNLWTNH